MVGRRKSSKKGGAATWSEWVSENTPSVFKSKPAVPVESPLATAPEPVKTSVTEGTQMAQTAGKRLKKHFRVNPASSKEMGRMLGTAKGDKMLGGKRRKTRRRR
jgi:hypothetical protein